MLAASAVGATAASVEPDFPLRISDYFHASNGVSLAWPQTGATAYTVQTRGSLTSGSWVNAAWRYRWPSPFTNWTDAISGLRGPRYYRVVAENLSPPRRGLVLTNTNPRTLTSNQVYAVVTALGGTGYVKPGFSVRVSRLRYETLDAHGLPIVASAGLILPVDPRGPLPLISVQHGATDMKSLVPSLAPSSRENETYYAGVAFATSGYAVVMPDYIGLGDSPGYQALLHAKSEATCIVDGLRAARAECGEQQVALDGRVFLFGFSQGGHSTMAAHREIEAEHTNEFVITASMPCAGMYDMDLLVKTLSSGKDPRAWRFVFPIMLASYVPIYGLAPTLDELLAPPYSRNLPLRLNNTTDAGTIVEAMPGGNDVLSILRPDFQADFRTNAQNVLRKAMTANSLLDWTPRAPMRLGHCSGDLDVPIVQSETAAEEFAKRGACCVELVDPGAPESFGHDMACYNAGLRDALQWFATFAP